MAKSNKWKTKKGAGGAPNVSSQNQNDPRKDVDYKGAPKASSAPAFLGRDYLNVNP